MTRIDKSVGTENREWLLRGWYGWRMTATVYKVSFGNDESALTSMAAQHCEYTKHNWVMHIK